MNDEGEQPQHITGDIEFENVVFTYPARPEAPVYPSTGISSHCSFCALGSKQIIIENPIG